MDTVAISAARYSRGAIVLHWLIAVLILLNIAGAWVSEDMPKPEQAMIMSYHKAIGIMILLLTVLLIVWRVAHRPPALADTLKAWEAALARVTHAAFYFLMLAIPLSGWAMASAFGKGKGVSIFGLITMPALPVAHDKPTAEMFYEIHEVLATMMLVLFVLHVVGALKHHFIDKDGTLRRVVPWIS